MQFNGKNSGSYLKQKHSSDFKLKKKSSVAIQTENFPNSGQLCNLQEMSMEEIKLQYEKTLNFLNDCHEYMNAIFNENIEFRIPDLPNYFNLLELFLEKSSMENIGKIKEVKTKTDLEKLNIGDGPIHNQIPRQIKSEDNLKEPSRQNNMKAISTNFEDIFKTCNEFGSKSIEFMLKHDVPNEPPIIPKNLILEKPKVDNLEQGDQLLLQQNSESNNQISSNSLEFTKSFSVLLNNLTHSNLDSLAVGPKSSLLLENLQKMLNQCQKPINKNTSAKKVNELFEKISKETKIFENNDDDDGNSSDSIIYTDAEFERMNSNNIINNNEGFVENDNSNNIPDDTLKSHPFKLNDKDKLRVNEKIIRNIGLFTEQGDLRPNVRRILEKNSSQNLSEKNVRFRTERKFDIEVRFNNQNMMEDSSEDDEEEEVEENFTLSVSTCSTISESEIINNAQT